MYHEDYPDRHLLDGVHLGPEQIMAVLPLMERGQMEQRYRVIEELILRKVQNSTKESETPDRTTTGWASAVQHLPSPNQFA
jgi:hypothetical protein